MNNNLICDAVIVAGGNGSRMGSKEKKQFIMLDNAPILVHTVKNISKSDMIRNIVVVAPRDRITDTEIMLKKYKCDKIFKVVKGGASRPDSVKCGLSFIPDDCDVIMIHDGVRPFIKKEIAEKCITDAFCFGGSVLGVKLNDTVIVSDENSDISALLDRNKLIAVQTPQCFKREIIKNAYEKYDISLTDDASQVIKTGGKVHITEGDYANIKITTPEDLISAREYLKSMRR